MPGLTNLLKFKDELQQLGNELTIRKERGDLIADVPMPANASDDGSQDIISDHDKIADVTLDDLISQDADLASLLNASTPSFPSDSPDATEDFDFMQNDAPPPIADDLADATPSTAEEIDDSFLDNLAAFMQEEVDDDATPPFGEQNVDTPPDFDIDKSIAVENNPFSGSNNSFDALEEIQAEENNVSDDFSLPDLDDFDFSDTDTAFADSSSIDDISDISDIPDAPDGLEDFDASNVEDFDNADDSEERAEDTVTVNDDMQDAPFMPESYGEAFSDFKTPTDLDDFFIMKPDVLTEENFSPDNGEEPRFDTDNIDEFEQADEKSDGSIASDSFDKFAFGNSTDDLDAFHIPGFSDTDVAQGLHKKHDDIDVLPSIAIEGVDKNSFTEEEYKKFLENLTSYPLNLRIAIEELIAGNEFADDVTAALILKVIERSSAKSLAETLSKLLDYRIDVPRDYEMRTAAEYAAYKSSFIYKLVNRILPAVGLVIVGFFVALTVYYFGREFVYRPIKAEILYKQGYALLDAGQYPQSLDTFNEAFSYHSSKKWFFEYARGYREKRQYGMAEMMYEALLNRYNNDKKAGLEYAQMEYRDILNYEKAEDIVRRRILDNYVNDKDGLLLLGDIYLDWATEKDPAKFEDARRIYASLLQLYGDSDAYYARMMRYFIRTDNLSEVLVLKDRFFPRKKSLSAQDLTELSGYLLDKLYGPRGGSDDYLRPYIEDVRTLLERAIQADPTIPEAHYNLARYFMQTENTSAVQSLLESTLNAFDALTHMTPSRILKNIDTYRMRGELYTRQKEYLKAEESYIKGIELFEREHGRNGIQANHNVGKLYADLGDLEYFISGDFEQALVQYTHAINNTYDTPFVQYRVGYIQYNAGNYADALKSFIKTVEEKPEEAYALLALANTLYCRGDDFAAQSYYERLLRVLDVERTQYAILYPQTNVEEGDLVELYLKATNNLGVTLNRISERTGDSRKFTEGLGYLMDSMRAWDAMTRNPETLLRLDGSNLAAINMKYITAPISSYEPELYHDIDKTLKGELPLTQGAW